MNRRVEHLVLTMASLSACATLALVCALAVLVWA
jgi:hypothetical protein